VRKADASAVKPIAPTDRWRGTTPYSRRLARRYPGEPSTGEDPLDYHWFGIGADKPPSDLGPISAPLPHEA
jgi:hypothetical protein